MRHSLLNNLEAFYPFNGALVDSTGNGHSLVNLIKDETPSLNVLAGYSTGKKNSAISFSNSEQSVKATSEILSGTEDGFSISFWYKPFATPTGNAGVFSTAWQGPYTTTIPITIPGCDLNFVIYNQPNETVRGQFVVNQNPIISNTTQVIVDNIPISINQWQHVVYTFVHSTSTQHVFINGQSFNNSSISLPGPEPYFRFRQFRLNDCHSIPDYVTQSFQGSIDSLGIWSKVLTSTEVTKLYNNGNGLELTVVPRKSNIKESIYAFFRFDGSTSSSATGQELGWNRASLSPYKGTLFQTSNKSNPAKFSEGKLLQAVELQDSNILVSNLGPNYNKWNLADLMGSIGCSFSFWANVSQLDSTLVCQVYQFRLLVNSQGQIEVQTGIQGLGNCLTNVYVSDKSIVKENTWYHYAVNFNNSEQTIKIYLNGCCIITGLWSFCGYPDQRYQPLTLGACTHEALPFSPINPSSSEITYIDSSNSSPVRFDSFGIWARTITRQEINVLYNEGEALDLYDFRSYFASERPSQVAAIEDKATLIGKTQFLDPMGYSRS